MCQVVDAIQWGGGVVAEFFRRLPGLTRFSGGGVVAEFSRDFPESTRFSGGGVAEFFSGLHTADATHAIHFSLLSINPPRRDSSVGGGAWPAIFR